VRTSWRDSKPGGGSGSVGAVVRGKRPDRPTPQPPARQRPAPP
jgi:hypothetical protein